MHICTCLEEVIGLDDVKGPFQTELCYDSRTDKSNPVSSSSNW